MKRILIYTGCFLFFAGTITSCKKKLEDDYLNPETTTSAALGKLFTGMLTNRRIHPTYWDYATFVTGVPSQFSMIQGMITDKQMYVPSVKYNGDRWSDYYAGNPHSDANIDGAGIVSQYREMQKNYNKLPAAGQADQYVFLQLAKTVYYDQTAQMIDLWGDIPFSEAGSLDASNTLAYGKYDDAAAVYDTLIAGLKDLNTWLSGAILSTAAASSL
ncbi:MAG TPA: SusD/RagB family nutrient-binding outer membrane lipoprotein, partial [Chitinophagaceae bacterium]|nr:SusD/RagB family nutrient-binding outer membrane lipoprotein [Chitinophagaceae bacterium]